MRIYGCAGGVQYWWGVLAGRDGGFDSGCSCEISLFLAARQRGKYGSAAGIGAVKGSEYFSYRHLGANQRLETFVTTAAPGQ